MVCIGVPYGTTLWQVDELKEPNDSFKIAMIKTKSELLKKRLNMYMDEPNLLLTDMIPCINYVWNMSFDRVGFNKKAIADKGWGYLDYNLLCYHNIKATMTKSECEELHSMVKSKHNHPNSTSLFS